MCLTSSTSPGARRASDPNCPSPPPRRAEASEPWGGRLIGAALLLQLLAVPGTLSGQVDLGVAVAVGAGAYDLSGDGTEVVLGGAMEVELGSVFVIEPGVRYFGYTPQFGEDVSFLLPELSLQAQLPLEVVRPYAGLGAGAAWVVEGDDDGEPTLHAAVGARVPVSERWMLRPEARLRSVDPWAGTIGDFTLGLVYRP